MKAKQKLMKAKILQGLGVVQAPRPNAGQLRFVRHHGWRTQARLDQKKKVGENNGQLRFVRHHVWRTQARLDQKRK